MENIKKFSSPFFLLVILIFQNSVYAGEKLIADFGSSKANTIFNTTDFPGLEQIEYQGAVFSDQGPKGLSSTGGDVFHNYQKITGGSVTLYPGDEIIVTWHNNSGSMISYWNPLISFEDTDKPVDAEGEPQWFPLFDYNSWVENDLAIAAAVNYFYNNTTRKTIYSITPSGNTPGDSPPSEGVHTHINISANSEKSGIICDKIEIRRASENRPTKPLDFNISLISEKPDSQVKLSWSPPQSGIILHYRIYRDGFWIAKTKNTEFKDLNLEHSTTYKYQIKAVMNQYALGDPSETLSVTTAEFQGDNTMIDPKKDIEYLGAFRYPDFGSGAGYTWTYRWGGMSYYPPGDPDNVDNDTEFPGSIYAFGHQYGHRVAEISIPKPVLSKDYDSLPRAQMLVSNFQDIKPLNDERPSDYGHPGIAYLPGKDTFYTTFGHYYNQSGSKWLTHGSFSPDYSNIQGLWYIGDKDTNSPPYYSYNKYMTDIPLAWANENTSGFSIASGANHTGADPMGPGFVAFRPWNSDGSIPQPGAELEYISLIQYDLRGGEKSMDGWVQKDFWMGCAWINSGMKDALVISGTKSFGEYYYGYQDGSLTAELGNSVPERKNTDGGSKGGQGRGFRGMLLFYNTDDLGRVSKSQQGIYKESDPLYMEPNQPQPYAYLNIDNLLLRENNDDPKGLSRITGMTFDRERGILYINEHNAAQGKYDVIHVFRVNATDPQDEFTIEVAVTPSGGGKIKSSSQGMDCGDDCTEICQADSDITLTAIPEDGYEFTGWSGDASGNANPLSLNGFSRNLTITGIFKKKDSNSDSDKDSSGGSGGSGCFIESVF